MDIETTVKWGVRGCEVGSGGVVGTNEVAKQLAEAKKSSLKARSDHFAKSANQGGPVKRVRCLETSRLKGDWMNRRSRNILAHIFNARSTIYSRPGQQSQEVFANTLSWLFIIFFQHGNKLQRMLY